MKIKRILRKSARIANNTRCTYVVFVRFNWNTVQRPALNPKPNKISGKNLLFTLIPYILPFISVIHPSPTLRIKHPYAE